MTATATRPAAPAEVAAVRQPPAAAVTPESPLTTSDHKRLGRYYITAAVLFALVGSVIGVLLELELSAKGIQIVGTSYDRLFSLHATATTVLFVTPLWIGLATYLVPLQIGARRLAFPRLAATAFWTYVGGGILLLASYTFGTPNGMGIVSSVALAPVKGVGRATDLWATSLILITLALVAAAANLFVTILKLRATGMTMARVPNFTWSILALSAAILLSGPVFLAGMLLVFLDQHYAGGLFAASQGNANLVWQHLVWLYGRPDVYLVAVPALGALSDVVATHSHRRLLQPLVAKGAIFATTILAFAVLASNASIERAVVQPTPSLLSAFIVAPIGLTALLWLGTIRPAQLKFHVSLLYVGGFALLLVAAGVNAAVAPSQHLVGGVNGSAWTVGQIHAALIGAPTMAAFAAVYHWSPKIWGKALNQLIGTLVWLCLFGGFAITSAGAWAAGYDGAPWHVDNYTSGATSHYFNYAKLASVGGVLVFLGLLLFLASAAASWAFARHAAPEDLPADPYEASTLEWAAASPPPPDNFESVPEIRSDAPLADLRARPGGGAA